MPTYDQLTEVEITCSSWNVFGRDEQTGTVGLPTRNRVSAALA